MSRAQASDPLHNFRFHVRTVSGQGGYTSDAGEAGFQSATLPELSAEAVEYREGHYQFTRKFPGLPQVSDMTLMRGVTKRDNSFYEWMMQAVGGGEYRTDLTVYHWHRDGKAPGRIGDLNAARKINCFECFPIRMKPGGDLDATSADVSIMEIDVAMERFEITDAE